jgi:tRNA nucleotidyltransferase (CCA-adding enzyme)
MDIGTIPFYGRMIDFVNLSSETYFENGKVLKKGFGTPLEDASRRDLTINSLYYNLHTK